MKGFLRATLSLAFLATLLYFERRQPLRKEKESKLRRDGRNLTVAALSALTIQAIETPVVRPLAKAVGDRRWGLLKQLRLPQPLEMLAAVMLMDYTLYLWHILTHRVPFLWRFHAVHHVDLDMDATTAIRFHFGEVAISIPYRAAQILILGIDERSLTAWQTFLSLSILFHHSNVKLPKPLEARMGQLLVTPRMHGIHHSDVPDEANSNWSSGLTIWDMIHGTLKLGIPQQRINIGVRGFDHPEQVSLPKILAQPFREEPAVRAFLSAPDV